MGYSPYRRLCPIVCIISGDKSSSHHAIPSPVVCDLHGPFYTVSNIQVSDILFLTVTNNFYFQVYCLGTILSMQISFVGFQPVQSSEHMAVSFVLHVPETHNGLLAGVSLPPSLPPSLPLPSTSPPPSPTSLPSPLPPPVLARPLHFSHAPNPLFLSLRTPTTQAKFLVLLDTNAHLRFRLAESTFRFLFARGRSLLSLTNNKRTLQAGKRL